MMFLDIHTHSKCNHKNIGEEHRCILNVDLSGALENSIEKNEVSLGLHPWYLNKENLDEQLALLESKLQHPSVKLIGECGFDTLNGPTMAVQEEAFKKQVELAEKYNKPVILHCVRAFDKLIAFKKTNKVNVPLIIHGFNKHPNLGKQLIDHGFMLSFGSSILKENNAAAKLIEKIDVPFFLETDDSPHSIGAIYNHTSLLRETSLIDLKDLIFAAWKKIGL